MTQTTHQKWLVNTLHKALQTTRNAPLYAEDDVYLVALNVRLEQGKMSWGRSISGVESRHDEIDHSGTHGPNDLGHAGEMVAGAVCASGLAVAHV